MSEQNTPARYDFTPITRPGANLEFFAWLAVLGLPALMLFMIYSH